MEVKSYAPSVEAYVEAVRNGNTSYHVLTEDIVSCNIVRNENKESTFTMTLQNSGKKYNGAFMPMDKITIYITKTERRQVFTGYITTTDVFTLYQKDFNISGKCPLYTLGKLYWDPGLIESVRLFDLEGSEYNGWNGYPSIIRKLLCTVGGWSESRVAIGEMPGEVLEWAKSLYEARVGDTAQTADMVDQFREILRTHGPRQTYSLNSSGGSGGDPATNLGNVNVKKIDDLPEPARTECKKASEQRQKIVALAISCLGEDYVWGGVGPGGYDCSGLVSYCLTGNHTRLGTTGTFINWPTASNPQPGDIAVNSHHTGVYIGDGKMIHAATYGVGVIIGNVQSDMKIVTYKG